METASVSLMLFILYVASNITAEDSSTANSSIIKTTADNKVYASPPEIPTDSARTIVNGTYAINTTAFVQKHTPTSSHTDDHIAAVTATRRSNKRHNNVTTYNISRCKTYHQYHFTLPAGESTTGHVLYKTDKKKTKTNKECQFTLTVPFGNVVHLRVFQCVYVIVDVVDAGTDSVSVFRKACDTEYSSHVFSLTHTVTVKVRRRFSHFPMLSLYFSAANESDRLSLEIIPLSQSLGYIQTPQWDGQRKYPPMASCVILTPPTHHVIFLSFQHKNRGRRLKRQQDIYQDRVVLSPAPCWTTDDTAHPLVFYLWKRHEPLIFPNRDTAHNQNHLEGHTTHTLSVSYFSSKEQHSGFRIRYSFHPNSSAPQRVDDGWNCSVTGWPDLSQHFPCDLVPQCVNAEDEAGCSYTTPLCGAGKVSIEGKCYIYKQPTMQTWPQARLKCQESGAFLASLESYQEWRGVFEFFLSYTESKRMWIGLEQTQTTQATPLSYMYTGTWRWLSGTVAPYLYLGGNTRGKDYCATFRNPHLTRGSLSHSAVSTLCSDRTADVSALCELPPPPSADRGHVTQPVTLPLSLVTPSPAPLVTCPGQHVTHEALACDLHSRCWGRVETRAQQYRLVCQTPVAMAVSPPYFQCQTPAEFVAYSLLCDFRQDCSDGSDETFCVHPDCEGHSYHCGNGQCVHKSSRCDGQWDCSDGGDEVCDIKHTTINISTLPPPAIIHFHRLEGFRVTALPPNHTTCPDTHFQCPGDGYCLPVYLRCNGFNDCHGHADEADCHSDTYRCPGFYRCRERVPAVVICLLTTHLCDGTVHCPLHDDELWCDLTCPDPCTCHGLAFTCSHPFPAAAYPALRYLEAAGSGLQLTDVLHNTMLVHLGVRACGLSNLTDISLLPNLFSLDLSDNFLKHVNFVHFTKTRYLRNLVLALNPMTRLFSETSGQFQLLSVKVLSLSEIPLEAVSLGNLSIVVPNLKVLDLSHSGLKALHGTLSLLSLEVLELRGCPIRDFSSDFMRDAAMLRQVSADHFKLCCPAVLPSQFQGACTAPSDAISSCDDLLKSDIYRAALAVFSMLSLVGNVGSMAYRFFLSSEGTKVSFSIFVSHLCVSDCLMGVYLALIGVADRVYLGSYLWKDKAWKGSVTCSVAGFLSLLSSEVSAFLICLITLDRLLVFRFPFSQLRFRTRSTSVACVLVWGLGLVIAAVPLLPVTAHWDFYRQTGICIPLPLTTDFAGQGYSFGVMIVINLVLFLLIAVGQALIFWSIRANSMSSQRSDTPGQAVATGGPTDSKDMVIARRLLSIAMTDFLCWFPIGLCGVLTAMDVVIPSEVNVAMAIFVLPLNAALNPFIYTLNMIQEKRRKAREARLMSLLKTNHV